MNEPWFNKIGETAGKIWHVLDQNGEVTFNSLKKTLNEPDNVVYEAIGWLAREGKIAVNQQGRNQTYKLLGH